MWNLVAAVFALVGTLMQAYSSLQELGARDPELRSAVTLQDMKRETPPVWRPISRREHRRVLAELRRESPAEAAAYTRVRNVLLAWSFLATAALLALIGAAVTI